MLINSAHQEIWHIIMVMSCVCCVILGVSAGNTRMTWGLKSSGSFFTHMLGAWLGHLRLALCVAWSVEWPDLEREHAESQHSKSLFWLSFHSSKASLQTLNSKWGREIDSTPCQENGKLTLKKSMLDGRCYGLSWSSSDYSTCHALAYNNKGLFHVQSLLWIQAILQRGLLAYRSGLLLPSCSFSTSLMIPQARLQGKSSTEDPIAALRYTT